MYTPSEVQTAEGFMNDKELEKRVYNSYNKAVLRLLVRIKTPKVPILLDSNNKKIKAKDIKQTWEHLVLFESDLTASDPLKSNYRSENYQEWLGRLMRQVQGWEVGHFGSRQLHAG